MTQSDIKIAVANMSRIFEARYGHLWVSSNDIDDRENLREKLYQWIEEFERENIKPAVIEKITKTVLEKSEFSSFPPNLNKFIFLCKEIDRMMNNGEEGRIYLELKRLDERFTFIYARLWSENDKDKSKRRLDFWRRELIEEGITSEIIKKTSSLIHKKGCYSQYPPSLNQFLMECLFVKSGSEYTDPDIAFIKASTKDEKTHPTIKNARKIIGSHTLKQSKDRYIRVLFEKIYIDECRKYVSNPEAYDETDSLKEKSIEEQPEKEMDAEENKSFFKKLI